MKKFLLSISCVFSCILFFAGTVCFGEEDLANAYKRGVYVRSLEQMLRLEPEEIDLATAVLIASEEWSELVNGRRYLATLDEMAYEIADRLENGKIPLNHHAIPVINKYLFDELGFHSVKEATDPNDLFLHSVLDEKEGYCLSLSVLYLSIGERIGLPLYGVVVPGHFFVRYDNDRVSFNIETTGKGGSASDEHYIKKFNVPRREYNNIYMINLDKMQTLGCFFNNLGNCYTDIGNIETAQLAFETAVEINPSLAESHTNLGNIYFQNKMIDDAIDEYKAAVKINPKDVKSHSNLGNAYTEKGWLKKAVSEYARAKRLDIKFVEPYKGLANIYVKQKKFTKAIAILNQAIKIEHRNADLYCQLGNAYSDYGKCKKALAQYKKAIKLKPNAARAYFGMGVCYNKLGKTDKEIDSYKKSMAIKPDILEVMINLGNAYFDKKDYDSAIGQYHQAIQTNPDRSDLYCNLGAAHANKDEYEKAIVAYEEAISLDDQMAQAYSGLAFVFYNLKNYEQAWENIKIAETLGADIPQDLLKAIKKRVE